MPLQTTKRNPSWQPEDLAELRAQEMDRKRLHKLIDNIDTNLRNLPNTPLDARKLRELRDFFAAELRRRGENIQGI
jgi:hypothetical protein